MGLAKDDAGDAEIVLTKKENGEEITLMLQSDGDMDAGGEDGEEPEDEDDLAFETEGVTAVLAVKKGEVQFDVAFKGDEDFPEVRRVAFVESGKGGMMGMMDINAITSSPYNGPDFETLDERLQEGILFYLQERLPNDAYKTLIAAANNKEKREYRRWLKKFKTIAS